ncbi:hypothetical protein LBMAG42_40730 [Deltaproteobacteria bacterium]|nr:hypothetical protein LBMAG42_40730 [Deltaproteobacteria bacterium]
MHALPQEPGHTRSPGRRPFMGREVYSENATVFGRTRAPCVHQHLEPQITQSGQPRLQELEGGSIYAQK